jgi:hypothetical protein
MKAAVVTGDRKGMKRLGLVRGALLAGVLTAVAIAFAPGTASAQITPIVSGGAYCARSSPGGLGPTPHGLFNVSFAGSGTVSASMWGLQGQDDECIIRPASRQCATPCQFEVQGVCEFHCSHDHVAPFPWPVEFSASPTAGQPFVGWSANCEPNKDAPRSSCILRWSRTQTQVSLTAHFAPALDVVPPAPEPSLGATPESYAVNLSWTPSADSWLAGYDVFRNGTRIARVSPGTTSYKAQNLLCQTSYTFRVDAFDWSGNEARSMDAVTTTGACLSGGSTGPRPNTVIHVKPAQTTKSRTAFFHFGYKGEVKPTKYQCKLDKGKWVKCSGANGKRYKKLKKGYHTFQVRAGNAAGWDATPAKWRWRIR